MFSLNTGLEATPARSASIDKNVVMNINKQFESKPEPAPDWEAQVKEVQRLAAERAAREAEEKRKAEEAAAAAEAARLAAIAAEEAARPKVVYGANTGDVWYQLRMCESGNNYATNTGNGYYGAYQYDLRTWANYGGYSRPDLAPPAVQDAKARETHAQRGWSPWPSCAAGFS